MYSAPKFLSTYPVECYPLTKLNFAGTGLISSYSVYPLIEDPHIEDLRYIILYGSVQYFPESIDGSFLAQRAWKGLHWTLLLFSLSINFIC